MTARYYRRVLLAELAIYVALAAAAHLRLGWGLAACLLLVPAAMLAVRAVLLASSMALAWLWRSPREPAQRLGPGAWLALLGREYAALLRFGLVDVPFAPWGRAHREPAPSERPAIVLLHGYYANGGCFRRLARRLEAAQLGPVHAPSFPVIGCGIEDYVRELDAWLERARAAGVREFILVGHSMGGLAARACLAARPELPVRRLVTLASPHHGTRLAALGSGRNARQMEPGSDFLRALHHRERGLPGREATSLYTPHDNMVMPQATSRMAGWGNEAILGVGHLAILDGEATWEALRRALQAPP